MSSDLILSSSALFEERLPGSMYEKSVESLVLKYSSMIFQGFLAADCKPYFDTAHGGVRPDMVLLRRDLKEWGLVEVELEEHSANHHVKPQIGRLVYASPDERAVRIIQDSFAGEFDRSSVAEVLTQRPRVYLVTHGVTPVSEDTLRVLQVEAINIRIFSGGPNNYQILARGRASISRQLDQILIRSTSPLTPTLWTLTGVRIAEFCDRRFITATFQGNAQNWTIKETSNGYIFRMPTHLSESLSFTRARISLIPGSPNVLLTALN